MLEIVRSGSWLTKSRVKAYCWMLLTAYAVVIVAAFATSHGKLDRLNRPLGFDFSEVYAAGESVLHGQAATPYDNAAHYRTEKELFGPEAPFLSWSYPPMFLAVASALALLPYLAALIVYQIAGYALWIGAMWRLAGNHRSLLPILAFPGAFINAINGQNGFLTAGLFAWSLALLEEMPIFAGVLLGLLTYKPQFGVLIPFALLAGGYWRTIASACATCAVIFAATWVGFGPQVWRSFFASTVFARQMTEQGEVGFYKIQTIFSTVRQIGGSVDAAFAAQLLAACLCAAITVLLWARRSDWRLKSAALMVGALLSTPYALDYDLVLFGPAIALVAAYIAERGPRAWEITVLGVAWVIPLAARPLSFLTHVSCGAVVAALLMATICRAAWEQGFQDVGERQHAPA
jgi:alpha-1,2-mannosyltransferase